MLLPCLRCITYRLVAVAWFAAADDRSGEIRCGAGLQCGRVLVFAYDNKLGAACCTSGRHAVCTTVEAHFETLLWTLLLAELLRRR